MQSGPSFRLIVRRGPQPNQQYELTRDTITIGRDITNDVVVNDPEVSRHHSRLIRTPSGYSIEDLRSTNGTFVNRQRLSAPTQLNSGDLVGLGETVTMAYEATGLAGGAGPGGATMPAGMRGAPAPSRPPMTYAPSQPDEYEDDYPEDRSRWIVIGCGILTLLFCCALVGAVIVIDMTESYCSLPLADQFFYCP